MNRLVTTTAVTFIGREKLVENGGWIGVNLIE